ncbi:MFS transporter, partial [Vibrio parahaemolyticus]
MLGMYISYAGFYFTRKTFNYTAPAMITDLGLDKGDLGIIGTLFYIPSGGSKFIYCTHSDRSNPRYFMGLGLIAPGLVTIEFGLSNSIADFITLWILICW